MSEADLTSPQRWTRRPRFSANQLLSAEQLRTVLEGQRGHTAMLMRALHGHGVIFGFAVSLFEPQRPQEDENDPGCSTPGGSTSLEIGCGMALDRHGRLLRWPAGRLCYEELAKKARCAGPHTLVAHYAERGVAKDGCGPCADQPDWVEEGIVFTLVPDCTHRNVGDDCGDKVSPYLTLDDFVCYRTGQEEGPVAPGGDLDWASAPAGDLCELHCDDTKYDAHAGIPIASVEVANLDRADCPDERWGFVAVAAVCEVRPWVYRTPLLYELVRGCQEQLARVESLSWEDWCIGFGTAEFDDDPVPWKDFARKFREPGELVVTFSKPIKVSTVHRGSVFFTVTRWEKEADYVLTRRIPANPEPLEEGEYSRQFRIVIVPAWSRNEIRTPSYLRSGGRVELTIRGQMLRDECGNMLNSIPIAYEPCTPVQDRLGGDFTAFFRFAEAPRKPAPPEDKYED